MNNTVKLIIGVCLVFFVAFFFCNRKEEKQYGDVNIQTMVTAADGLDLKAVGELLKKADNGQDFERLLNQPGGVNNLDLNEDDKVDYISVTEYGDEHVQGFSLTTEPVAGEVQEVATIEVEKIEGDQANVVVHGNEHVYGHNHYYHYRHSSLADWILIGYLFSPHRTYYHSPWGYGHYPQTYTTYQTVNKSAYNQRTQSYKSSSTATKTSSNPLQARSSGTSTVTSPNKGKTASKGIRAPLSNPTTAQKSFQAKNPSKQMRSGGFGKSSSKPSVRKSTSSRSGSRSGGK